MLTRFVFFAIVVFFGLACMSHVNAQSSDRSILSTHIDANRVNGNCVRKILKNLAFVYDIPIGLELLNKDVENAQAFDKAGLLIRSGSLEEVLNQLVETQSNYRWKVKDRAIFVFPVKRDSIIKDLLDYRFGNIKFEFSSDRIGVDSFIFDTPQIKEKLSSLGLTLVSLQDMSGLGYKTIEELQGTVPDSSIDLNQISVKELLNRLLKQRKIRFWCVTRWGDAKEFISIIAS